MSGYISILRPLGFWHSSNPRGLFCILGWFQKIDI